MRSVRGLGLAVTGVMLLAACGGEGSAAPPSPPTVIARPSADIWVLDVASGTTRPLVTTPLDDVSPAWSPTGGSVAFARVESGDEESFDFDIWIADVASGALSHVLEGATSDFTPAWAPDGAALAFTSNRADNPDVWIVALDGSEPTQVTSTPDAELLPEFAPDGTIVFVRADRDHEQLWSTTIDGTDQTRIIPEEQGQTQPAVSADGRFVAYLRVPQGRFGHLVIRALDGSSERTIADLVAPSRPTWSPDGRSIAVRDDIDGKLHVVDVATGDVQALTHGDGDDYWPTWSPDGRSIAFATIPAAPGP